MGMCRYCQRKKGFMICNGDCLRCERKWEDVTDTNVGNKEQEE